MAINAISLACAPVEVFASTGAIIGIGTSFLYSRDEHWVYLVTNWHIVTGRQPSNPSHSKNGAIPTSITLKLHKKLEQNRINRNELVKITHQINSDDGEAPNWLEHPTHRYKVDVVVVRIPYDDAFKTMVECRFLTEIDFLEPRFIPGAMDEAFVIGYPWGLTGGSEALPLYKRGSVASEPAIDESGLPRFLIDCRTASAMSGAPVICARRGLWSPDGQFSDETRMSGVESLAGVYSGRLLTAAIDAAVPDREQAISEIGIVWKVAALREIIEAGVSGTKLSALAGGSAA